MILNERKKSIVTAFNSAAIQYEYFSTIQKTVGYALLEGLSSYDHCADVIVDIGCGTGYLTALLQDDFPSSVVVGLDLACQMLVNTPLLNPVVADFDELPFADQSVDIIVANLSVQWSACLRSTLKAWRRILKPSGILLMSTLLDESFTELRSSFQSTMAIDFDPIFLSREKVLRDLDTAGFSCQQVRSMQPVLYFPTLKILLQSLKKTGTSPPSSRVRHHLLGKQQWLAIDKNYQTQYGSVMGLPLTYDVLCVSAS